MTGKITSMEKQIYFIFYKYSHDESTSVADWVEHHTIPKLAFPIITVTIRKAISPLTPFAIPLLNHNSKNKMTLN